MEKKIQNFEYRGYSLQAMHNSPQWQVQISSVRPGLPELPVEKKIARGWNEDEVVKRAKARIDEFLESRHAR